MLQYVDFPEASSLYISIYLQLSPPRPRPGKGLVAFAGGSYINFFCTNKLLPYGRNVHFSPAK